MGQRTGRPSTLTLVAFAFVVIIGGTNFVAVRFSNRELQPFYGAGVRFVFASALLFGVASIARVTFPRGRKLASVVLIGALQFFASYAFVYWGLQEAPAAFAGVMFGMVPLFTLILAVGHRIERFRIRALVGALIAICGVLIIAGSPGNAEIPVLRVLSILLAVIGAAESGVLIKRLTNVHPFALNAIAQAVGATLLLALSVVARERWAVPRETATILALLFVIPVGSVLLFILYVYVVQHWTASGASYQFVFFPIVSAVAGALLLDEPLDAALASGAVLVMAGTYVGALAPTARPAPEEARR